MQQVIGDKLQRDIQIITEWEPDTPDNQYSVEFLLKKVLPKLEVPLTLMGNERNFTAMTEDENVGEIEVSGSNLRQCIGGVALKLLRSRPLEEGH